jgi:hypothetical protein
VGGDAACRKPRSERYEMKTKLVATAAVAIAALGFAAWGGDDSTEAEA